MFSPLWQSSLKRLSSSLLPFLCFSRPLDPSPSFNFPRFRFRGASELRRWSIIPFPAGHSHGRLCSTRASAYSFQFLKDAFSTSSYLSVRIRCRKDVADMLSEALLCFGASSVSVDEMGDCDSAEEIYINSIFTEGQDIGVSISHAADSIGLGLDKRPSFEVAIGKQCNWVKNSLEMFQPVEVTSGLWIIPEWTSPCDIHATNIILNPGLAFGTGEHPTTKLCLLLLHGLIEGGESFLDYGTGSGILAIAAIKLGAAVSVGVDIDPQARTSARQNASLNKIQPDKMPLYLASESISSPPNGTAYGDGEQLNWHTLKIVTGVEKFDIVVANILLNPLVELADQIVSYAKPGAVVGLSGILSEQISQVEECYRRQLNDISVSEMDGWACVSGVKK